MLPTEGQIVHVRSRQYLVEQVVPPDEPSSATVVKLSCLDDDAQGEALEVLWEREVDARVLGAASWEEVASKGFDRPKMFSAYLHTLRWNCVTATEPRLFQAPYRAGIEVKAFQLEPLRKALLMPRVNLFIADDVGIGKTIEAGLILREMLMRQKIRRVVISAPPSVVRQWKDEMEQRFGLSFVIYDREFVARCRQERGFGINPFKTHSRFIISHALLRNEDYAGPLRDWLGGFCSGSMLILDEAHNAAPASGSRYAIDSKLTRTVRDLSPRFEHRLFLSATPHNGHSNSFSALLEILDPQRFCRGVPIKSHKALDAVMVRRLKKDLLEYETGFPERKVLRLEIDGLPEDAPELVLSRLLHKYRALKESRLKGTSRTKQASAMLVVTSLQKRLLSSIEAFARTLEVHRRSMKKLADKAGAGGEGEGPAPDDLPLLRSAPGADDVRAGLTEEEVQAEEEAQVEAADAAAGSGDAAQLAKEMDLLEEMAEVAGKARHLTDSRVKYLLDWIRDNMCTDLGSDGAAWNDRRVLIFTEYADTKRYLVQELEAALEGSDRAGERIKTFHGGIGEENREEIKRAFNTDPAEHSLRILVATDAAREGVNLQNHCANLFHFDVPWNPGRMEQRNGRIDRKLQREPVVHCHYFVLPQRAEDRVLDTLVRKTGTIKNELGSVSPVVERRLETLLGGGIRHDQERELDAAIGGVDAEGTGDEVGPRSTVITEELEEVRQRRQDLAAQIDRLRQMLETSREWIGLDDRHFHDALSASLEILGAEPLKPADQDEALDDKATARWVFPPLHERQGADLSWSATLDSLRTPRKKGQKPWEWRKEAPILPVIFRDPGTLNSDRVHLHLEHRVVKRLLGRFLAQGFLHKELTRACVVRTDENIPRVVVLGRLSLYGDGASRLHDEVVAIAAEWSDPENRGRKKLRPMTEGEKADMLRTLEDALASKRLQRSEERLTRQLAAVAARDISELIPHLERRAEALTKTARRKLEDRGEREAKEMLAILQEQRALIEKRMKEVAHKKQLELQFNDDEQRQLAADRRHWDRRLSSLEQEMKDEPERIRGVYTVKASRIEPVGLVYLWPLSS